MTLLLDTHAFLWYAQNDPALSRPARALLVDPANAVVVSVASCWEIAIKVGKGNLSLGTPHEPSATYIPSALLRCSSTLLPIKLSHATAVESLPHHHRDPFDRLLIAQALAENIPIVSIDAKLDPYGVTRLW